MRALVPTLAGLTLTGLALAGVLLVALLEADPVRGLAFVWAVLAGGGLALAWLAAAWGYGTVLRIEGAALAAGVGVLLLLDGTVARLGLLNGRIAAVALLAPGWALAAWAVRGRQWPGRAGSSGAVLAWLTPALVVLALAAASTPGWLWATEFGGYDALSYHLALPREWLAAGRMTGLEHNVYSFFPSALEAAYLHVAALTGDDAAAALGAQFLHAGLAVATAVTCAALARDRLDDHGRASGIVAAAFVIGTPWVLVTGSLAYTEMGGLLMLAAGLAVLARDELRTRDLVAIGLFAGTATACKLTNAAFVAVPLVALLVVRKRCAICAAIALGAALLPLLPWLLANGIQTGNPVFPFLPALGTGHWTAAQAEIWARGHAPPAGVLDRLGRAWSQLGRYGIGPNPQPGEPWRAQWLILPWLALAAGVFAWRDRARRGVVMALAAVLIVQLVAWIGLTHVQSRFMTPGVVPMALLVALAVRSVPLARGAALAWTGAATVLFTFEGGGHATLGIGTDDLQRGGAHAALLSRPSATHEEIRADAPATYWVNFALPRGSRVLLIGEARSFYFDLDRVQYQTTWDRGPWSQAMAESPGDETAWARTLRGRGFTHVLVDPDMLEIWARSGWNDPALTADGVVGALERTARLVAVVRGRERLYALE